MAQFVAIWYAVIVSASVLTSSTGAYFNDSMQSEAKIQAGTWWDGSNLRFVGNTQNLKACTPIEIAVQVENKGFKMTEPRDYEVYYSDRNGIEHIKNGKKVGSGVVEPIGKGETAVLSINAEVDGYYMFRLLPREEYKNEESNQELWSKRVMVTCKEKEDKQIEKEESKKELKQKAEEPNVEQPSETEEDDNKGTDNNSLVKQNSHSSEESKQTDSETIESDVNAAEIESKKEPDPNDKVEVNDEATNSTVQDIGKEEPIDNQKGSMEQ